GLIYFAFDLLCAGGEDFRRPPLTDRKSGLKAHHDTPTRHITRKVQYIDHIDEKGTALLRQAVASGLEGIVSKQADAPHRSGRSASWVKVKARPGHEVVIGAWKTTHGKFRSLMVGVNRGGQLVYSGIVGTGFGAETVKR